MPKDKVYQLTACHTLVVARQAAGTCMWCNSAAAEAMVMAVAVEIAVAAFVVVAAVAAAVEILRILAPGSKELSWS